jgi:hypothetical protein
VPLRLDDIPDDNIQWPPLPLAQPPPPPALTVDVHALPFAPLPLPSEPHGAPAAYVSEQPRVAALSACVLQEGAEGEGACLARGSRAVRGSEQDDWGPSRRVEAIPPYDGTLSCNAFMDVDPLVGLVWDVEAEALFPHDVDPAPG